jgi:uncharacterized cupredoxin-like copper-binding protein
MSFLPASALGAAVTSAAIVLAAGCGSDSGSGGGGGGAYGGGSSQPATKTTTTAPATPKSASAAASSGAVLPLTAGEGGGLSFTPGSLTAKAGTVTLKLANPGSDALPHAVAIEGQGVARSSAVVQPGGTSTVTITLKPGKYTFYCPVGSHRANGMQGQLTVS